VVVYNDHRGEYDEFYRDIHSAIGHISAKKDSKAAYLGWPATVISSSQSKLLDRYLTLTKVDEIFCCLEKMLRQIIGRALDAINKGRAHDNEGTMVSIHFPHKIQSLDSAF